MSLNNSSVRPQRRIHARPFVQGSGISAAMLISVTGLGVADPAIAASITRSVVVRGEPAAVWELIGPFCSIRNWLPPVGTCQEDGAAAPTRTLVTKDGKTTFVERQTARRDDRHFYSYQFLSSPLPVSRYHSTLKVSAVGQGRSRVTWRSTYQPNAGSDREAKESLEQIYSAGLDTIRMLAEQDATMPVAAKSAP